MLNVAIGFIIGLLFAQVIRKALRGLRSSLTPWWTAYKIQRVRETVAAAFERDGPLAIECSEKYWPCELARQAYMHEGRWPNYAHHVLDLREQDHETRNLVSLCRESVAVVDKWKERHPLPYGFVWQGARDGFPWPRLYINGVDFSGDEKPYEHLVNDSIRSFIGEFRSRFSHR